MGPKRKAQGYLYIIASFLSCLFFFFTSGHPILFIHFHFKCIKNSFAYETLSFFAEKHLATVDNSVSLEQGQGHDSIEESLILSECLYLSSSYYLGMF